MGQAPWLKWFKILLNYSLSEVLCCFLMMNFAEFMIWFWAWLHGSEEVSLLCRFNETAQTENWYCQKEHFVILTDPAERSSQDSLWVPFLPTPGRLVSRPTGPDIGINDNMNNFGYLLYNSAVTYISQASYSTPRLYPSGDVWLSFNYSMYGTGMGSVYVTTNFDHFDTFQRIDDDNPKKNETNGRIETLVARGDQGNVWKYFKHLVELRGYNEVQIGIQVIKGNGVLSDVAFDNVKVTTV